MAVVDISVVAALDPLWRGLVGEAAQMVQRACRRIASVVVPEIREIVRQGMGRSPESSALLGGQLRQQLGIADAGPALAAIVEAAASSVRAETLPATGNLLGGVNVGIFAADFSDVLSAPGAEYVSVAFGGRQTAVPWLRWMLFEGDSIVVQGYKVLGGVYSASRTEGPIMGGKVGGPSFWKMPAEYAGTERSNWITRVAEEIGPEVLALLEREASHV